jgi:GTP-binding protein EngB required for normal cell division
MPQMNLNTLISDWLSYVEKNKISQPEDTDLINFLNNKGFDEEIFLPLVDRIPEKRSSDVTNSLEKEMGVELSDQQVSKLNRIKSLIKNQLSKEQRRALRRELESE